MPEDFQEDNIMAYRFHLSYDILENFFSGVLHMRFDTTPNQMNIIVLRGAKPVSPQNTFPTNQQDLVEQLEWETQTSNQPEIKLVNDVWDRFNDVIVLAWTDADNNKYVRVFLGSGDPGDVTDPNALRYVDWLQGYGFVAQGQHTSTWGTHVTNGIRYSCLDFIDTDTFDEIGGRWISSAYGKRLQWIDGEKYFTLAPVLEAQLHGATGRATRNVTNASAGCSVYCGGFAGRGQLYEQILQWYEVEGNRGNRQLRFNVLVWNAWDLYRWLFARIRRGQAIINYRVTLDFGTRDWAHNNVNRLVERMQNRLEEKTGVELQDEAGVFGNHTGDTLREFQRVCYEFIIAFLEGSEDFENIGLDNSPNNQILLRNHMGAGNWGIVDFRVQEGNVRHLTINPRELRWERDEWICGPETWKLLECNGLFVALNVPVRENVPNVQTRPNPNL